MIPGSRAGAPRRRATLSKAWLRVAALFAWAFFSPAGLSGTAFAAGLSAFAPGAAWPADDGSPVDSHGGNILRDAQSGTYYWYGEHYGTPRGIACYSSGDLYNWKFEGVVFPRGSIGVLERPKVIYNAATRKYAMWFHYDSTGYKLAQMGVALSDSAKGPFVLQGHFRPNGHQSRDLGMFADDDGKAYLLYAADSVNVTIRMVELSADYAGVTANDVDLKAHCEGPALMKRDGIYYLITSQCTGWDPNRATYYTAANAQGPYTGRGDPCVGDTAHTTFDSQSCYIFKIPGYADGYMFMGDRWNGSGSANSRYVFLPISVPAANTLQIRWYASWDLKTFGPSAAHAPLPPRAGNAGLPVLMLRGGDAMLEYGGHGWRPDGALVR